ncbi:MAG TPA: aspartate carbamoyltransferase catalytic subunit [Dehalococcoidia bacterium]|nr:aspartate carbamoyltransferase catalytic subunit [Dehalococcoidia bacterium]
MLNLFGRSIVSVDDLSNEEIEEIFLLADQIRDSRDSFMDRLRGRIMATLFYEPSTRTRLSFESSMQRLGGGVISAWDMAASSVSKGETLADTVRVVGKYADVLVLRHSSEGAARYASELAGVPVVNAGDGAHEHPTQTLCDLYTLRSKHGHLAGLKVAICGDLQYGRTIHSLIYALARFGASVILLPGGDRELPEHLHRKLSRDYGVDLMKAKIGMLRALYGGEDAEVGPENMVDAVYVTPTQSHQLSLLTEDEVRINFQGVQLYITRAQKERWAAGEQAPPLYPKVNARVLSLPEFKDTSILHPLPRVDEISPEVDEDPRSLYFQQAANGIPIRMALLLGILGQPATAAARPPEKYQLHSARGGTRCENQACVTRTENVPVARFRLIPETDGYRLRCAYCDSDFLATYYGNTQSKVFHSVRELAREAPSREHVVFFKSEADALEAGFRPASPHTRRAPSKDAVWPPLLKKPAVSGARPSKRHQVVSV